jgi:hypothetical protein
MNALVVSVSRDGGHRFNKQSRPEIRLIEGLGVEGDAHVVRDAVQRLLPPLRGRDAHAVRVAVAD